MLSQFPSLPPQTPHTIKAHDVDTLVSKIKPCMSKYKSVYLKLRIAHYISYSLFDSIFLLG